MEIRLTRGEAQRGTRDPGLATCIRRIKTSSPTTHGDVFSIGRNGFKRSGATYNYRSVGYAYCNQPSTAASKKQT